MPLITVQGLQAEAGFIGSQLFVDLQKALNPLPFADKITITMANSISVNLRGELDPYIQIGTIGPIHRQEIVEALKPIGLDIETYDLRDFYLAAEVRQAKSALKELVERLDGRDVHGFEIWRVVGSGQLVARLLNRHDAVSLRSLDGKETILDKNTPIERLPDYLNLQ
jgi:hypothetical protein